MLSTAEIARHLDRLTYRPGWTFEVYDGRFEGQHLVIRAEVDNSYQPGQLVVLDIHSMLPPMRDVAALEDWLGWRLRRVESHEQREWFKRDGVPVADPHAEGADQDR